MPLPKPTRHVAQDELTEPALPAVPKGNFDPKHTKPSDTFIFEPQPGMNAYELGVIMVAVFNGIRFDHRAWSKLPDAAKRHFKHVKIA
jgi:hypothetical protein